MDLVMEPFTAFDDYLAWVERRPDEEHYEVVDGQPVMSPSPTSWHQFALTELVTRLRASCAGEQVALVAPLDWVLWERPRLQVRQPDLVVVTRADLARPRLTRAPVLAVEILSPTSFERDVLAKRREYAQVGLDHYWIVDPEAPQIAVHRRRGETLELVAHAAGDSELAVEEPVRVRVRPSDLRP